MNRVLAVVCSAFLLSGGRGLSGRVIEAQTSASPGAQVSFQFERVGLAVPRFKVQVAEDGTGTYQADQAEVLATERQMRGQSAQHIDRPVQLSPSTTTKIFKLARDLKLFKVECASKAKNIADTGKKTLSYSGPDGSGSCLYNYSENKMVMALTDTFLGIAYTLDEGRRLDFLHRYDRLGLDEEMNTLAQEVEAGRALELGTISPTLAAIADDSSVIQRARLRATKMLE